MTFGQPWALLGLLALPLVAILWVRRAGKREAVVGTLSLWRAAAEEASAETGRRLGAVDWSMVLGLAFVAVLFLAASEPTIVMSSRGSQNVLVILDRSASMRSTDAVGRTRIQRAGAAAEELVRRLGPSRVTLVELPATRNAIAGEWTGGVPSGALSLREATDLPLDMDRSLAGCAGLARERASIVVVLTDNPKAIPPSLGGRPVLVVSEGGPSGNIALDAFEVSRSGGGLAVFAGVKNWSGETAEVPIEVAADGMTVESATLRIGPGQRAVFNSTKPLPGGVNEVEVRLKVKDDLECDNRAVAVRSGAGPLSVAYVGRGNPFVLRSLELLPGVRVAQFRTTGDVKGKFGLYVYDGVLPDALPAGDVVLIDPVGTVGPLTVERSISDPAGLRGEAAKESPLLRNVDVGGLRFYRAAKVKAGPELETLVRAGDAVALARWQDAERRVLAVGCGLTIPETNWPMLASFPIFWSNVVAEAAGRKGPAEDAPAYWLTGERVPLAPGAGKVSPEGRKGWTDPAEDVVAAGAGFVATRVGVYRAESGARYAVNMLHESESNNAGAAARPTDAEVRAALASDVRGIVALWKYLAVLALALGFAYWALWARAGR